MKKSRKIKKTNVNKKYKSKIRTGGGARGPIVEELVHYDAMVKAAGKSYAAALRANAPKAEVKRLKTVFEAEKTRFDLRLRTPLWEPPGSAHLADKYTEMLLKHKERDLVTCLLLKHRETCHITET